ncbi:hypothetical protein L596_003279 [Steinernema carpocapsae]|uniref:Uncharacterized protein n=1 Tax=Steinernema carpocapsae TaxID=34508 RepID=A0A4U8UUZ0_STECR|nr:hypothetical protein L596_003279 [Steinernema carpocapsae]
MRFLADSLDDQQQRFAGKLPLLQFLVSGKSEDKHSHSILQRSHSISVKRVSLHVIFFHMSLALMKKMWPLSYIFHFVWEVTVFSHHHRWCSFLGERGFRRR